MDYIYRIFIMAFLLFFTEEGTAQARFKATALAGINMSQIDGDKQQGYRKAGVSLGLNGSVFIRPDFDVSAELLYNQKGAKPNSNGTTISDSKYSLGTFSFHYSEVALLANYYYNPNKSKTYYTQSLHVGLSYGRLLKSSISIIKNNVPFTQLESEVTNHYNPHDFSFIVGWSQLISPKIGITIRHTSSINFLYKNPNYDFVYNGEGYDHLKPYFLSFHLFYNLISPNKVMGLRKKKKDSNDNPLEELY